MPDSFDIYRQLTPDSKQELNEWQSILFNLQPKTRLARNPTVQLIAREFVRYFREEPPLETSPGLLAPLRMEVVGMHVLSSKFSNEKFRLALVFNHEEFVCQRDTLLIRNGVRLNKVKDHEPRLYVATVPRADLSLEAVAESTIQRPESLEFMPAEIHYPVS